MIDLTTYHLFPPFEGAGLSFHFGRQGIGLEETSETLASDSLFAALVAQAALLSPARGEEAEPAWATPFVKAAATPPLRHSSLFPRLGELVLLPRPLAPLNAGKAWRETMGKGFKKLRYLSPDLFTAACTGAPISETPLILQGGKVWISRQAIAELPRSWQRQSGESDEVWRNRLKATPIWTSESTPRVTVDRVSNTSAYYEVGRVSYTEEAGLALLVRFDDPAAREPFEQLLTLLSESGLGGRRSSGYGAFRWQPGADLRLDLPEHGPRAVLLSRYIPRTEELAALQESTSTYQLVRVGGWLYSQGKPAQRRQRVRMVSEGAILAHSDVRGQVVDVRPDYSKSRRAHPILGSGQGADHPVYRSGLALALPIPAVQEEKR
jgi:CRISPR-associated protein Csm4